VSDPFIALAKAIEEQIARLAEPGFDGSIRFTGFVERPSQRRNQDHAQERRELPSLHIGSALATGLGLGNKIQGRVRPFFAAPGAACGGVRVEHAQAGPGRRMQGGLRGDPPGHIVDGDSYRPAECTALPHPLGDTSQFFVEYVLGPLAEQSIFPREIIEESGLADVTASGDLRSAHVAHTALAKQSDRIRNNIGSLLTLLSGTKGHGDNYTLFLYLL
jgi:hypothetical protein